MAKGISSASQMSRYGAIARQLPFTFGKVFFVGNTNDSWFADNILNTFPNDGDGNTRVFSLLSLAYAACVSGRNDVIIVDANSSISEPAGIAWTKSRINVIGVGQNRFTDNAAKISIDNTDSTGYVLKVTGTRNSFTNIKFIQNSTNAAALSVLQTGGEGNVYRNCSFIFANTTNLGGTTANEVICGEDSGTFEDCEFGADTLLTTAARTVFLVKQVTSGQQMKSCRVRRCTFKISSSSSSAVLLSVNSTSDVLFTNLFEDCTFYASVDASGGVIITNAVQSIGSLTAGTLGFVRAAALFCTHFCNTLSANVQAVNGAANATTGGVGATPS